MPRRPNAVTQSGTSGVVSHGAVRTGFFAHPASSRPTPGAGPAPVLPYRDRPDLIRLTHPVSGDQVDAQVMASPPRDNPGNVVLNLFRRDAQGRPLFAVLSKPQVLHCEYHTHREGQPDAVFDDSITVNGLDGHNDRIISNLGVVQLRSLVADDRERTASETGATSNSF